MTIKLFFLTRLTNLTMQVSFKNTFRKALQDTCTSKTTNLHKLKI